MAPRSPCQLGRPGSAPIFATAFSRDGRRLAAGAGDGGVSLWDTTGEAPAARRPLHERAVRALTFAGDGASLVTGGSDGVAWLWRDCPGGDARPLRRGSVWSLAELADGGQDGAVRLWDATTWRLHSVLDGPEGPVWSVAFAPDGRSLAAGCEDGTIRLWDVN